MPRWSPSESRQRPGSILAEPQSTITLLALVPPGLYWNQTLAGLRQHPSLIAVVAGNAQVEPR
ncbi:hypothetical protein DPMN_116452 [Dreissena polymorpha]|uniref:Uncharacterized protein n=1 Tax=Dreissena polymorpha TaxID=45954 RepID=A0A9D4KNL0_DREPO|nr:hypothetical protein DPMN_116452 [Dreissena polymorpha]